MRLAKISIIVIFSLAFGINVFAQRNFKPLEDAEIVINKNCASTAEVIKTLSMSKGARIYLFMDEKYFTKSYLVKLFSCISREYVRFNHLNVTILSDRKELDIEINEFLYPPPSIDPPALFVPPSKPSPPPNYARAYYDRFHKEYFEYSPNPKKWRMVTYNFRKPSVPLFKFPNE
jgi:hypothetical protein